MREPETWGEQVVQTLTPFFIFSLTLVMGVVSSGMLSRYRKHAFIIIMMVAAVITPPDLMTLVLVTIPLYLLYEASIRVVRFAV